MSRILITGDKGFVGSNIRATLEQEHEMVGLEARGQFRDWSEKVGFKYVSSHNEDSTLPMPPGWTPQVLMAIELPRLE